jgi:cytochrome c oxidase subunit 2
MAQSPYGWWLPLNASAQGAGIDNLINLVHVFMALLFVGWGIYLTYCLVKFRERPGEPSRPPVAPFRLPVAIEVGIAIFEIVLLLAVASPLWFRLTANFPSEKEAMKIRVVAEQFAWNIHYPGRDGKFGRTRPDLVTPDNPVGLDRKDPDAADDIVSINMLHVPVRKPVIAYLSSKDVVHNFFLPVLRVKQDIVPGIETPVWFEAAKTGGDFEIACAQLCGLGHFRMRGSLSLDTPEQFEAWMREEEKELLGQAKSE